MRIALDSIHFEVDKTTRPKFWKKFAAGRWEPHTLAAIRSLVGPGSTFVDIGGWIGPTTLAAASLGATVHTFEPDPVALGYLRRNIERNPELAERITVHPYALSGEDGTAAIHTRELGDSRSSLVRKEAATASVEVRDVRPLLDTEIFRDCTTLKIDIEGGEFRLVPLMRTYLKRYHPPLLLSVHTSPLVRPWRKKHKAIRVPVTKVRAGTAQLRLLRHLVGTYDHWYVPQDGSWRRQPGSPVRYSRLGVGNKEYVAAAGPLALSAPSPGLAR